MELPTGIEPVLDDYESPVLPLNYRSKEGSRYSSTDVCMVSKL